MKLTYEVFELFSQLLGMPTVHELPLITTAGEVWKYVRVFLFLTLNHDITLYCLDQIVSSQLEENILLWLQI
jgi:hypothetical protein